MFPVLESGIIEDISTSPDEVNEPPSWSLKKLAIKSVEDENLESPTGLVKGSPNANQSPNGSNPYINESVAVHL